MNATHCQVNPGSEAEEDNDRCQGAINVTDNQTCYSEQCYARRPTKGEKYSIELISKKHGLTLKEDTPDKVKKENIYYICDRHVNKIPYVYLFYFEKLPSKDPLSLYIDNTLKNLEEAKKLLKGAAKFMNDLEKIERKIEETAKETIAKVIQDHLLPEVEKVNKIAVDILQ